MSINFPHPPNELTQKMMEEFFGKPVASDGKTNLFDALPDPLEGSKLWQIARAAGQPVSTEMNAIGDLKTMEDGTQWRLGPDGWYKVAL